MSKSDRKRISVSMSEGDFLRILNAYFYKATETGMNLDTCPTKLKMKEHLEKLRN